VRPAGTPLLRRLRRLTSGIVTRMDGDAGRSLWNQDDPTRDFGREASGARPWGRRPAESALAKCPIWTRTHPSVRRQAPCPFKRRNTAH